MKKLTAFLQPLNWSRILTAFILSMALFLTTACNNGDIRGARPNNPPVQMGGQNNPYKQGGDAYTKYNMSSDPSVSDSNHPTQK
jgi:hypothetical protein